MAHTASSFLLACGPGIPHGVRIEDSTLLDMVASVLEGAGVPIPEHFDGRPLPMLRPLASKSV